MTIQDFHDSARELLNIGQSQYFPPEAIDLQLNTAIRKMFKQEYKHFEETQEITDTLGFYKKKTNPPLTLNNGEATLPEDFYHMTEVEAILEDDTRVNCELLTDAEWLKRKHSKLIPPSKEYPIARAIGQSKVEVLPTGTGNVKSVVVFYLREPAEAKYGYDLSSNGTSFVYNESESTDVDYPELGHPDIQDKLVHLLGVVLRDNTLMGEETVSKSQSNKA